MRTANLKPGPKSLVWPFILMAMITTASGTTNLAVPQGIHFLSIDKLAHFITFGILALSIIRLPFFGNASAAGFVAAVVVTSLFGFFDELHQSTTPGRFMEIDDWIADTAGAVTASTLWRTIPAFRRVLEFPLLQHSNLSNSYERRKPNPQGNPPAH